MVVIWKFPLAITDRQHIEMPLGGKFLHVDQQASTLTLWAAVDPTAKKGRHTVRIVGTGHEFPPEWLPAYVGTVQMNGFVWHVFVERA